MANGPCVKRPKEEWLAAEVVRTRMEQLGYRIRRFRTGDRCYEILGTDPDGREVELFLDPKDGSFARIRRP